jgi:predicted ArsR family transcriptional regulator
MEAPNDGAQLAALASLGDPTRRRLYDYVVARPEGAGRDEAARALGISRMLAAFHLDKLLAAGLLAAEYRRLSARRGPGGGRPSKIYRRADRAFAVQLPPRRYVDAAQLLAAAVEATGPKATRVLHRHARDFGRALGEEARRLAGPRPTRDRLLEAGLSLLRVYGFEPGYDDGTLLLRNCPFHALAQAHRETVCHMNLQLLTGFVRGLGARGLAARLEPAPGRCCIVMRDG